MKKVISLLAAATLATAAHAEGDADDPAQSYIASLCKVVTQEKFTGSADEYIARLQTLSPQSTQQDNQPFDEDEARTVVAAWMNLSEEQKTVARQSAQACEDATSNEYQSQD
ncbi:hypothetical protein LU631_01050 [Erwinia tracheiphila]|uniref:Uncharacterized protein n=1 Tax=Erwinia tracheiphila TaxID=65700 RepID=A0A0M2KHM0_9GAMM|nr:hypothetical protein [Erwinia tracheiphila]EOS94435.1 hypothetical protein ETR_13686 [Erwinia tracheiphila PSU-1]KKF36758.1 hypothetical protein SY86_17125 [Erwinia tracheiphila]UIA88095.1 hypothetical protein LU631_01050 [Erwinia tracheiphila]UIA96688.1 hypothetical protein LU633_01050 [Erwinia tracheiphila]